jgi:polysaccharide export outer membrane protein
MTHLLKRFPGVIAGLTALVLAGCETPNLQFGSGGQPENLTGEVENQLIITEPVGVSPTERGLPPVQIDIAEEPEKPKKRTLLEFFTKKDKSPVEEKDPDGPVVPEQVETVLKSEAEQGSIDGGVEYKLSVGDNVVIKIGEPIGIDLADKLNGKGNINLPIIGDISAVGLTVTDLEDLIKKTYVDKEITKVPPHVTVQTDIKVYYIQGEVRSGGGRYPLLPPMTLTKAVAAAGGFTEWVKLKNLKIYRGNKILTVDYTRIKKDPRADVEIMANDLIIVDKDGGISDIFNN